MHMLRPAILLLLIIGILAPAPAVSTSIGDEKPKPLSLRSDGGDVLLPKRAGDYHWYIGLDAGLTWSSFMNGPLTFYMPNPYNPRYLLPASVNEGDGLGLYFGATVDLPLSDIFGIVLKGNYHTRAGSFDETNDMFEVHPQTSTSLNTIINNKTEWTFNYIGIDLLARVNLGSSPIYFLVGPSFGFLNSNTAKLDQTLVQPDDIFYTEDVNGQDEIVNEFRTASIEEEVTGFKSSRIDLKFGLGWWIELNENLFLTPEITVAYPLTTFVDEDYLSSAHVATEPAEVFPAWRNLANRDLVIPNKDFNMLTAFFTIGLRWRMN